MTKKIVLALICLIPFAAFAQDLKFGYYNRAEIFQSMPETVEAIKKLDKITQSYEAEIVKIQDEYQKKGSEYIASRDTLDEPIRARRETEIQDIQQRLQSFYQDSQTDVKNKQQEFISPINKKLDEVVKSVGAENGFTLIFDVSANSGLSYWSPDKCIDATNLIRAKLNLK
jgi:outer membrane protein